MVYKNKEKQRAYQLAWQRKNRNRLNLQRKEYRLKNLVSQREYHAKWMREHRNPEYQKQWRLNNIEWIRNWNINNREKFRIYSKTYSIKHPEARRKYQSYDNPNFKLRNMVQQQTRKNFKIDKECGICKNDKNLSFHHWIYKLPVEKKHFSTLCNYCHSVQHGGFKQ